MANNEHKKQFLELFLAHRDHLYAFIRVMVQDPDLAEDLLQETSVVLWEKIDTFQKGTSFAAWSRQVALNKIRNERRRLAKMPVPISDDASMAVVAAFDDIEGEHGDEDWTKALRGCLKRLSSSARTLVDMRYFKQQGLQEIAEQLGRTAAGVNSALCKARKFLESCILKVLNKEIARG